MVADAVRAYYDADIAFINSGSLRCDRIIEAGAVIVKDMIDIIPFDNTFVVKRFSGRSVATALEKLLVTLSTGDFCTSRASPSGLTHTNHLAPVYTRCTWLQVTVAESRCHQFPRCFSTKTKGTRSSWSHLLRRVTRFSKKCRHWWGSDGFVAPHASIPREWLRG
ncbi:hypothetical protein BS17DRAFT_307347 [Gyrodon lividus]|nr:hypothetical protein BS17DRAFT_307347 [Gyrodon lividus]